jgi:hypothetical protein
MLIFAQSMQKIKTIMQSLDNEYVYTDEGDIKSYVGIDISKILPGTFKLFLPHLSRNILAVHARKLQPHRRSFFTKESP